MIQMSDRNRQRSPHLEKVPHELVVVRDGLGAIHAEHRVLRGAPPALVQDAVEPDVAPLGEAGGVGGLEGEEEAGLVRAGDLGGYRWEGRGRGRRERESLVQFRVSPVAARGRVRDSWRRDV